MDMEMGRLNRKKLTLQETTTVASAVVAGKAGYLLQLGQYDVTTLRSWDATMNKILRNKAALPFSSSAHGLHAAKNKGGMQQFTFFNLAQQSLATELIVRLNKSG